MLSTFCFVRTFAVPTRVTLWAWRMLARCVTRTGAARLLRMMDSKQHLQWHTNWVSKKKKKFGHDVKSF